MPKNKHNYWVVGATWYETHDDKLDTFKRRGYWLLGHTDEKQPAQARLRDKIKPGDRIAIKKMLGQGSKKIEIRALGIVKEIDDYDKRIYIHWAVSNLERKVPSKGCFKSIHGPFPASEEWTRLVFQL
jgi:hypothetical protein